MPTFRTGNEFVAWCSRVGDALQRKDFGRHTAGAEGINDTVFAAGPAAGGEVALLTVAGFGFVEIIGIREALHFEPTVRGFLLDAGVSKLNSRCAWVTDVFVAVSEPPRSNFGPFGTSFDCCCLTVAKS
jgi:hypothetical protein